MGDQRKKMGFGSPARRVAGIPLLCLLLLVGTGGILLTSRQTGAVEGQQSDGPMVRPFDGTSAFFGDPNAVPAVSPGLGNGELFLKMMFSVVLVLGLGGAALYLSKKVLPRVAQASGKEIHILETAYLGPRKMLHLVEVGGRQLLLASTNETITMLASVSCAWSDGTSPLFNPPSASRHPPWPSQKLDAEAQT